MIWNTKKATLHEMDTTWSLDDFVNAAFALEYFGRLEAALFDEEHGDV